LSSPDDIEGEPNVTVVRKPSGTTAIRRAVSTAVASVAATAGFAGFAVTGTAHAATATNTVKVTATDDAYTSSARPTFKFGSNPVLVTGTKNGDRMLSFLKFKVATLPAGKSIAKAELKLTRDAAAALPGHVKVKKVATSWTEAALTHATAPTVGDEIAVATPAATAASVTFDLTKAVTAAGIYAFAVTNPVAETAARFHSSEKGSTGPQLTITLKDKETAPAPAPAPAECTVDAKLVPSCGVLWGAAAGGFSDTPRDQALREWEAKSGRTANVYHTYHRGDEMFPTAAEIAMANETGKPRVLFTNWKVGYGTKWANVAAGQQDARIDKLSAYIKANYKATFFMAIHHEPENDVNDTAGSGMTAKDYAAMFAHTVKRMKANGVTNVVFVMAYMNIDKWNQTSWWKDLYPGNDVVDWVGVDAYVNAEPNGYNNGDFNNLMNRTSNKANFPGWYNWALTTGKPIMAAEWGVYECMKTCSPTEKAKLYDTVLPQLRAMDKLKAIVYFDTASDQAGKDMRIDSTPESLTAFKKVAADPLFNVKLK
jgi:beta-mannanase